MVFNAEPSFSSYQNNKFMPVVEVLLPPRRKEKGGRSVVQNKRPGLASLFLTFFIIGLVTFGGGYAMLPVIQREVVQRRRWFYHADFADMISLAQSAPGAIAVNIAIFCGRELASLSGALVAALGTVLPSFLVILGVATSFPRWVYHPLVAQAFAGIRPAVTALIVAAVLGLAGEVLKNMRGWILAIATTAALLVWGLHPIAALTASALAGFLWERRV